MPDKQREPKKYAFAHLDRRSNTEIAAEAAAPAQPVPNDREKEFHDAVQRVGEYFNWDLPAFMASVKRDQETRNIAPSAVPTQSSAEPMPCPKCGGPVEYYGHGAYCPKPTCKWRWDAEIDGSPLQSPEAERPVLPVPPEICITCDRPKSEHRPWSHPRKDKPLAIEADGWICPEASSSSRVRSSKGFERAPSPAGTIIMHPVAPGILEDANGTRYIAEDLPPTYCKACELEAKDGIEQVVTLVRRSASPEAPAAPISIVSNGYPLNKLADEIESTVFFREIDVIETGAFALQKQIANFVRSKVFATAPAATKEK